MSFIRKIVLFSSIIASYSTGLYGQQYESVGTAGRIKMPLALEKSDLCRNIPDIRGNFYKALENFPKGSNYDKLTGVEVKFWQVLNDTVAGSNQSDLEKKAAITSLGKEKSKLVAAFNKYDSELKSQDL